MKNNISHLARNLRKSSTESEKLLWKHLRLKQLEGLKFRRQQPIGNYIVDFVCFSKRIIIELDGGQHAIEENKDCERDRWLKSQGFTILRFWNNEVMSNTESILELIRKICLRYPPPPLPQREGKKIYIYRINHNLNG